MAADYNEIKGWIQQAQENGCTHLIVAVDKFDYEDYPVYVSSEQNVEEEISKIEKKDMQGIMEVYSMSLDIEKQLAEQRAYHI